MEISLENQEYDAAKDAQAETEERITIEDASYSKRLQTKMRHLMRVIAGHNTS